MLSKISRGHLETNFNLRPQYTECINFVFITHTQHLRLFLSISMLVIFPLSMTLPKMVCSTWKQALLIYYTIILPYSFVEVLNLLFTWLTSWHFWWMVRGLFYFPMFWLSGLPLKLWWFAEHLDPINVKIAELREALESVTAEQKYLRARDARHRHSE